MKTFLKIVGSLAVTCLALVAVGLILRAANREHPSFAPLKGATDRGAISGLTVDEKGAPLGGVELSWLISQGGSGGLFGATMFEGSGESVTSAPDGSFEITDLEPGEVLLRQVKDYGVSPTVSEGESGAIEVRSGYRAEGIVVEIEPVDPERILSGQFLDASGAPVPFMELQGTYKTWLGGGGSVSRSTDSSGRFRFVLPKPGLTLLLTWKLPDGTSNSQEFELSGGPSVTLRLP